MAPPYRPRVVFTSSIAAYGAPFPDTIADDFLTAPQTCYGTQKVIGELLLADYRGAACWTGSASGCPTSASGPARQIRPHRGSSPITSRAARRTGSSAAGRRACAHVARQPALGSQLSLHAAAIDLEPLGVRRSLMMPGVSATVGEQIEALRRAAGESAVG